jgi:hypothetical protein
MAVTIQNAVFLDIETQSIPHRKHVTSLQSPASSYYLRLEVFKAVTMQNAVFWDVKTQFVPHRKHINSPIQIPASSCYVGLEGFTAVTI